MYISVKAKLGGGGASKKSTTKGVEYDAMGTKWNKAMWDNMESKKNTVFLLVSKRCYS